eukprot:7004665-Pyramimonas_sp.AAC.1
MIVSPGIATRYSWARRRGHMLPPHTVNPLCRKKKPVPARGGQREVGVGGEAEAEAKEHRGEHARRQLLATCEASGNVHAHRRRVEQEGVLARSCHVRRAQPGELVCSVGLKCAR